MNKHLVLKYLQGNSTPEETRLVEEWVLQSKENTLYFNQIKTKFTIDTFEKTSKEVSVDGAYRNFKSKHIKSVGFRFKKQKTTLKYAAAVLILITSGYFIYIGQTETKAFNIPNNAITLELQDGTKKVIDEQGVSTIIGNNGEVIGKQQGKQLVYQSGSFPKELTHNTLNVPYGKTFELRLSDGTVVHLNAGSSITYPVEFIAGKDRMVSITGEAYLNVTKDSQHPFIVNMNNLNVRVLGTEFNVTAYPEDAISEVVLVSGAVAMYNKEGQFDGKGTVFLEPGFKGSFNRQTNNITKDKVVTGIYTSWLDGMLVFREMTFENILKKLERHYNVVIVNNNKELSVKHFNANFGKQSLTEVLNELKKYYGIQYKVVDGKIVIR